MRILIVDLMFNIDPIHKVRAFLMSNRFKGPVDILLPVASHNLPMLEKLVGEGHAKSIAVFGEDWSNPFSATSRALTVADSVIILIDNTVQAEMLAELVKLCKRNKKDFDIL